MHISIQIFLKEILFYSFQPRRSQVPLHQMAQAMLKSNLLQSLLIKRKVVRSTENTKSITNTMNRSTVKARNSNMVNTKSINRENMQIKRKKKERIMDQRKGSIIGLSQLFQ